MPVWMLKYAPHLLVLVALVGGGWYLHHSGYKAGEEAVQVKWDRAVVEATIAAKEKEAADAIASRELQDALTRTNGRLEAATARGDDLAYRLSLALRSAGMSQAAGAAPGAAGPAGESRDSGPIERAAAAHFSACARDAERLSGWQEFWKTIQ